MIKWECSEFNGVCLRILGRIWRFHSEKDTHYSVLLFKALGFNKGIPTRDFLFCWLPHSNLYPVNQTGRLKEMKPCLSACESESLYIRNEFQLQETVEMWRMCWWGRLAVCGSAGINPPNEWSTGMCRLSLWALEEVPQIEHLSRQTLWDNEALRHVDSYIQDAVYTPE